MFLPNTDSFVLIKKGRSVVRPSFPALFLPNRDSFLLRQTPTPVGGDALSAAQSALAPTGVGVNPQSVESTGSEQPKINDQGKRNFLKAASIAGVGVIASQILLPKKASALILGSSPTTGVVGVKNAANTRINPATEETVSTLATQATASTLLKTSDLTFDAGSLKVKSFSDSADMARSALVDSDRHMQVDVLSSALPASASTETTLQTISFGGTKFALRLATDSVNGNVEYLGEAAVGTATAAASWRIKKINSTTGVVIQWADGNASFDNIYDNRESLTYS